VTELNFGPAGPVLDSLGVEIGLAEGQQVVECVLIAKVVDFKSDDPTPGLAIASSEGLDWIARDGLLNAAVRVLDSGGFACGCDDEG
jgi:hypothetical protein